jgi:hypothetical protein
MSFTCALCSQTRKLKEADFTKISSIDVEEKIKQAYEDCHGIPLLKRLLNEQVHKKCYWKYHRHYTYTSKNKRSSTTIQDCLLTRRLPLVDRTNYRLPSSLTQTATSANQYSQQSSVNEAYVLAKTTCTSWLETSSVTTDINQKVICFALGIIKREEIK